MSYILDALKKADAEREQGQVPGLHTQIGAVDPMENRSARSPLPWVAAAGVAVAVLGVGTAWWWPRPATVVQAPMPTSSMAAPTAAATLPASTVQASSPVTPMVTPAPAPGPVTLSTPAMAPPRPSADVRPAMPATRPPSRAEMRNEGSATPASRVPGHVDPAQTASTKVPLLSELPDEVRRSLPALAVSGAMYSDNPANRMLLVNNRVFHEGDQPVAGLVLEEIRLKSAVFRYRGTRYAVSY